jgi:hypothetical protein
MLTLVAILTAAAPASPADKFISAEALRAHVSFLADDALEGRGPATRGDVLAQRYIAAQFGAMGLKPLSGPGGWYQPFDLVGVNGHPKEISARAAGGKAAAFKFHDEFIAVSGHQLAASKLESAEVVFVGFGITAPEFQ